MRMCSASLLVGLMSQQRLSVLPVCLWHLLCWPKCTCGSTKAVTDLLNLLTSISIHLKLAKRNFISPLLQALANVVHSCILILQERPHVQTLQLLPKAGPPNEAVFLAVTFPVAVAVPVGSAAARGGWQGRSHKTKATDHARIPAESGMIGHAAFAWFILQLTHAGWVTLSEVLQSRLAICTLA